MAYKGRRTGSVNGMYVLWVMLAYLVLYMVIVAVGPSPWDRLLGLNLIATKTVVIIIVFASVYDTAFLLDFAIVYALFGFIGTIFVALFLSEREKRKLRKKEESAVKAQEMER